MHDFTSMQRSPFSDVPRSLLKTMTMTTGELDYDAIFRLNPAGGSDRLTEIKYPPISYLLWIVFLVLMPVILNNMLVCCFPLIYLSKSYSFVMYIFLSSFGLGDEISIVGQQRISAL